MMLSQYKCESASNDKDEPEQPAINEQEFL